MGYTRYMLSKTGLFPKMEPDVADVLKAATMVHDVKYIVTPRGGKYYYVIPVNNNLRNMVDVMRIFRSNGVTLRLHKSGHYKSWIFRTPSRGQRFMRDVMRVNHDIDSFQRVLAERAAERNIGLKKIFRSAKEK